MIDLNLGTLGSGFDLIKATRKELGNRIPVIVISGSNDSRVITHALELGATDYLLKPLDKSLLASKLSRYVESAEIFALRETSFTPPEQSTPAKLHLDMQVTALDEISITLMGKHLIPKGTAIRLGGKILQEITDKSGGTLVTVTATGLENDCYSITAEFDASDTELLSSIRAWLSTLRAA